MTLRYASTFAGIEGFGVGFDDAGMTCTAQVEISRPRLKVLARHYPNVPKGEDIADVNGRDLGNPDVLVGGFPCKDLSIGKGNRAGLDGARSGLYWEFHRLLDEHLRLVDSARPRFTVIENVPGILSQKPRGGRDMAAVLLGLEELGYGWAFRVVDSRGVGSAQRRPRVIIIGHRGGDPRPAWSVLADAGDGGIAPALRGEPAGPERPSAGASLGGDGVRFFRKSSRPRAAADAGGYSTWKEDGFANVLTPNDGLNVSESKKTGTTKVTNAPWKQTHLVVQDDRVRALTPLEWERLQGFPDNWTAGLPDAERYYALGDAMNVHLARWLGRRLVAVAAAVPLLNTPATA